MFCNKFIDFVRFLHLTHDEAFISRSENIGNGHWPYNKMWVNGCGSRGRVVVDGVRAQPAVFEKGNAS